ncbi:uncharacterized protein EV422DRAFT_563866 [Fimicolochytrium jonesii]|uniref:uncharacterized protein n=1 Tax=Fimicolochytrium jonesii TaxID=1396493 RepID=UPI0022FF3F57|nr:uncharacterized protein EV422DRAFT_563866 [Fimicolochytrium jonesii]KAI8826054.1 hypothetical protein EV422DRAFT_563866 [Fimicolochytrium jonesii]
MARSAASSRRHFAKLAATVAFSLSFLPALTRAAQISSLKVTCTGSADNGPCNFDSTPGQVSVSQDLLLSWTVDNSTAPSAAPGTPETFDLFILPGNRSIWESQHQISPPDNSYLARNVAVPALQQAFRIPSNLTALSSYVLATWQSDYNSSYLGATFTIAAAPSNGTDIQAPPKSKGGSYIALIMGLCAVFGLIFLLTGFFTWRWIVRNRPGYKERKMQRKHGISVIAYRIRRFYENVDQKLHSLTRGHSRSNSAASTHNNAAHDDPNKSHVDLDVESLRVAKDDIRMSPQISHPALQVRSQSPPPPSPTHSISPSARASHEDLEDPHPLPLGTKPVRPAAPCFRPSEDRTILPPRLCKTYVWQSQDPPSPRDKESIHRVSGADFYEDFEDDRALLTNAKSMACMKDRGWDDHGKE